MKKFIARFWRSNMQLNAGGYETTRIIEAKSIKSAEKIARTEYGNPRYGGMTLLGVKESEE